MGANPSLSPGPDVAPPARIWAALRGSRSGRRALTAAAERRVRISVLIGDRSRVVLRATS